MYAQVPDIKTAHTAAQLTIIAIIHHGIGDSLGSASYAATTRSQLV